MAFDLSTAKPVQQSGGFDLSTAQPGQAPAQPAKDQEGGVFSDFGAGVRRGVEKITGGAAQRIGEGLLSFNQKQLADFAGKINSGEIEATEENLAKFDQLSSMAERGKSLLAGAEQRETQRRGEFAPISERSPIASTIGEVTGQVIPTIAAAPGSIPASLLGRAAFGATAGGLGGASQPTIGEETAAETALPAAALGAVVPVALQKAVVPAISAASQKAAPAVKAISDFFTKQSPFKQKVAELIEAGETDNITAKFIINGSGKVKTDPILKEAVKQGFDEGVVAAIKGSSNKDRQVMSKMVETLKRGMGNARFAAENRPTDAVGDSVLARFKAVVKSNKEAGMRLDKVARSLKGDVDFNPAVSQFLDDLDGIGVSISEDLKPIFKGSDIEDLAAPENIIKRVAKRMSRKKKLSALDIHKMKKFIDEQVTFGKSAEGLGGKTERILKSFRRNLDQALDSTFPEYNAVNTKFADTISALDNFKDAAGSKFNPLSENADKFVGTLTRRLLSNAQSRVALIDSLKGLQDTAVKYGSKFDDDIITQTMFADELSRMFGSAATTSFEGGIEKAVKTASGRRGVVDVGLDVAAAGVKAARGVNEENSIKAIEKLLRQSTRQQ